MKSIPGRHIGTTAHKALVLFVAILMVALTACSDGDDDETVGGYEVGQILYGDDPCPTASVSEVSSAFPEMGTLRSPTLATEGPQYVCNFSGDGEGNLRLLGGATGNAVLSSWGDWTTTEPVPQPLYIYDVGDIEVWMVETPAGGLEAAFKGLDNSVWRINAVLEGEPDREVDVELTMVRVMLSN